LLKTRACWAEARIKIARMTLTIKLDRNWSSFQLANSAPPLSVTGSAIAPSARMRDMVDGVDMAGRIGPAAALLLAIMQDPATQCLKGACARLSLAHLSLGAA
jgi:hypothetical protein